MRTCATYLAGIVLLLGVSVKPAGAAATTDEITDPWERRRLTISAQLGIASPGGLLGVDLEYAPVRWLAFGAGAGPTLMGNGDLGSQMGVWIAPRWVFGASALGVDAGLSMGPYRAQAFMDEHGPWAAYGNAVWLNTGVRYQYLADEGFALRVFAGAATLLNASAGSCGVGNEDEPCRSRSVGYGGVALGYAF